MDEHEEDRDEKGRFAPGHRFLGRLRTGIPNKMSKSVREKVLAGFDDGASGDGITAFVRELKRDHPPAAAGLLAKMMPSAQFEDEFSGTTINAEPVYESINFEIMPVAAASYVVPAGTVIIAPDGRQIDVSNALVDAATAKLLSPHGHLPELTMIEQRDAAAEPAVEQRDACPGDDLNPGRPAADDADDNVVPLPRWRTTLPPLNERKQRFPKAPGSEFD